MRTSSRHTLILSTITGPLLILSLALTGLAVTLNFLDDQHRLLKQQQSLALSTSELRLALKSQSQLWNAYLLYHRQQPELWQEFREQERRTLERANHLLVGTSTSRQQQQMRAIVRSLEVLRMAYQQARAQFLNHPADLRAANQQVRHIDETPAALIESLYREIHHHAAQSSDQLSQRALWLSGLFALLLLTATLVYSRWSARHALRFLHRQAHNQERVQWLLQHDYLTQLMNRNSLIHEIEQRIEQQRPLYALHISLANIKDAGQLQGHSVQDQLIRIAASRLLSEKRPQDLLARAIGEEFILIAEDDDQLQMRRYARRLLQKLEQDFSFAGFRYQIGSAIGISHYPRHAGNCSDLLRCADIAAVHSRASQLHSPCLYSAAMATRITDKTQLVNELKAALSARQLKVVFQPQVDLVSQRICGLEALARLTTDNPRLNGPDVFIPLAEETGLIHQVGQQVCRQAIETFSGWWHRGQRLSLAINISARQLEGADFVDQLCNLCREFDVPTAQIDIELTESNYMGDHRARLHRLREHGFRLSIDDFGTGYSNLGYLSELVPQQLKIDKSFIDSMTQSGRRQALVKSMVGLAKSQGIEVVAEGIETELQAHLLRQMEVDTGQGYLFSRPLEANAMTELLQRQLPALPAGSRVSARPFTEPCHAHTGS